MNHSELDSNELHDNSGAKEFRVDVPAGIGSKEELLKFLSTALHFPAYFGRNWDALEECLSDLSWIPEEQVVIQHQDVPLASSVADSSTYLDVLRSARATSEKRLKVLFPSDPQ